MIPAFSFSSIPSVQSIDLLTKPEQISRFGDACVITITRQACSMSESVVFYPPKSSVVLRSSLDTREPQYPCLFRQISSSLYHWLSFSSFSSSTTSGHSLGSILLFFLSLCQFNIWKLLNVFCLVTGYIVHQCLPTFSINSPQQWTADKSDHIDPQCPSFSFVSQFTISI